MYEMTWSNNGRRMTTTDDVTPIRISGPTGLLAVVPTMLGFHPSNSLVLMCLSGDRRRVGPVARVDLPRGHDRAMATQLAGHAQRYADEVVVISYQSSRRRPPMLDDLLSELARARVDVMDAIVVRGGRARPALSAAMERAHPGVPVPDQNDPQVRELAAAGAQAGRSVLTHREQMRRSLAGPQGERLKLANQGIDVAAGRVSDGLDAVLEQALAEVDDTGNVRMEIATALAVLLTDSAVRDAAMVRGVVELDRPWLPMLIACASWTPDPLAAPLCSVLAMVAYRHGDGALAQIAVDRCLKAEPEHPLAHLMIAIMSAGLHPDELERIACNGTGSVVMPGQDLNCEDLDCHHQECNDMTYADALHDEDDEDDQDDLDAPGWHPLWP